LAARLTQQHLYLGILHRIQHQQTNYNISDVWHAEIRLKHNFLKHNFMRASEQLLQLSRMQLSQHCEKQKKFAVFATAPAVPQGHGCSCHHKDN
jgi:N-acetylglutamate synthase-like GNAT family acetyltransferase